MSRERFDPSRLIRFAWIAMLLTAAVQCSKDCIRLYRRDIMQVWRVAEGSGLCNVTTNCSSFMIDGRDQSWKITSTKTLDIQDYYASYSYYSGEPLSVLLHVNDKQSYLVIKNSQDANSTYKCYSNIDDTGFGYTKYYWYVPPNEIIVEGQDVHLFASVISIICFVGLDR